MIFFWKLRLFTFKIRFLANSTDQYLSQPSLSVPTFIYFKKDPTNRADQSQYIKSQSLSHPQVGLAVDDIKSVQDNAMLSRLAMQVNLNLDVERMLPDCLRRRFVVRKETVWPNKRFRIWTQLLNDANLLTKITKTILADEQEVSYFSQYM